MKVSEFKSIRNCEKGFKYSRLMGGKNKRPLLMETAICELAGLLKEKADNIALQKRLSEILIYEDSWFESAFQRQTVQSDDLFSLMRFANWFQSQNIEILETNVMTTLMSDKRLVADTTDRVLCQNVNIIGQMGDKYVAFIISRKIADHSPKGRSAVSMTQTQPEVVVAKTFLENTYSGIHVGMVHLFSELDEEGNMYPDFIRTDTKKSNLLMANFKDFIEEGVFDTEAYLEKFKEYVGAKPTPNCEYCQYSALCKGKALRKAVKHTSESTYVLPTYTEEQQKVVDAISGPMCVVAGPGSGKTAVLVGRVKNMLDKGIRPERVLVITYTKKAAEELITRISSFCTDMPYISTINALCDNILRQNEKILGKKYKVLTSAAQLKLIENLIMALPRKGFAMKPLYGKYGLLNSVKRALELLDEIGDYESFKSSSKLRLKITDFNDFFAFAEVYKQAVEANDYITFDEQVSLTIKLFREHPEVLATYQGLFSYIMVDEYQDVNRDNAEFIYLLAGKDENLCVVGDDDQNIYAFRGGDPSFMINFPKHFPKARSFVLSTNFRSTKEIVDTAKVFVEGNVRISKDIKSYRGSGKAKPSLVAGNSPDVIEELCKKMVSAGYNYGDIAVLSTVNADLERLKETLTIPCELAKTYLINDPLFEAIQNVLSLYYNGLEDNKAFYYLMSVLYPEDAANYCQMNHEQSLYDSVRGFMPDLIEEPAYYYGEGEGFAFNMCAVIAKAFHIIDTTRDAKALVTKLSDLFDSSGCEAEKAMVDLIRERCLESRKELAEHLEFMALSCDDARVELEPSDSVTLITAHESKGKEWPVVILQNGEKYDDDENGRRLIYVASTRAKDVLLICHDKSKSVNLSGQSLEEIAV